MNHLKLLSHTLRYHTKSLNTFNHRNLQLNQTIKQLTSSYSTDTTHSISTKMVHAKFFTYAEKFSGKIKPANFLLQEEELPTPQDGEFIVEALYLSVDPYMRAYAYSYKIGQVMIGLQVAQVIESKNSKYPVGAKVCGNFGWRSHTLVKKDTEVMVYELPDLGHLSPSLGLGVLGQTGNSAYFGFLTICKPKEGETLVVSGAAGAVGNQVGQIGLIKGLKVVGLAGSEEKCTWLKSLGFHAAINYKQADWQQQLAAATPDGVDCYFDNVGGAMSDVVLARMNLYGRISVCGSISAYNDTERAQAGIVQPYIVGKRLRMEGFNVMQFQDRWPEGVKQNLQWVTEGKLKFRETYTTGFENMPTALIELFEGVNVGKSVVVAKGSSVDTQSVNFQAALHSFKKL